MSDIEATDLGGTEPVVTDTGTPDIQVTEPVGDPITEPSVDTAPPQTYVVKVGGVEQEVTLEDLQSGFMRQADYTRKTQEIAQMRQRLAQAEAIANSLETDPQGTLRALAQAFGIEAGSEGFDPEVEVDPTDQRLSAIERQFQQRQAQEVRAQIDNEIDTLLNTYGDFDLQKVITHAASNGMTVTAAYRDLHFDAVVKQQKEAQVMQQKRDAAVVEGGAHRAGVVEQTKPAASIREIGRAHV